MTMSMQEQVERIKEELDALKAGEEDPRSTEEIERELMEEYKRCKHVMDDIVIRVDRKLGNAVIHNRDTMRVFTIPLGKFRESLKVCNTTHPFQRR